MRWDYLPLHSGTSQVFHEEQLQITNNYKSTNSRAYLKILKVRLNSKTIQLFCECLALTILEPN